MQQSLLHLKDTLSAFNICKTQYLGFLPFTAIQHSNSKSWNPKMSMGNPWKVHSKNHQLFPSDHPYASDISVQLPSIRTWVRLRSSWYFWRSIMVPFFYRYSWKFAFFPLLDFLTTVSTSHNFLNALKFIALDLPDILISKFGLLCPCFQRCRRQFSVCFFSKMYFGKWLVNDM